MPSSADPSSANPTSTAKTSTKRQKSSGKCGLAGHHGWFEVSNHFEKMIDEEAQKVVQVVHMVISSPTLVGTNKLWTHKDNCKEFPAELRGRSQTALGMFQGALSTWKSDQELTRRSCAEIIITDKLPFLYC